MLEYEVRPLRLCAQRKSYQSMMRIWQTTAAWDTPHLIYMLDFFMKENDATGINAFLDDPKD